MPDQIYPISNEFITHIENISLHVMLDRLYSSTSDQYNDQWTTDEQRVFWDTRHSHISAELFVCREGELLIDTPNSMLVLHAGDVVLIPPGIQHYKVSDNANDNYYAVRISCKQHNQPNTVDLYKQFSPFFQGKEILIYRKRPEFITAITRILALSNEPGSILPAIYTAELLLTLSKISKSDSDTENNVIIADSDYNRLDILEQYISAYFMNSCIHKEIAAKLHISLRQLDRISRKHLGMSVHQAVMERRISVAENMLLSTDMTAEK